MIYLLGLLSLMAFFFLNENITPHEMCTFYVSFNLYYLDVFVCYNTALHFYDSFETALMFSTENTWLRELQGINKLEFPSMR